jgi:DNA-binding MarR family transcriptional regulator
MDQQEIRTLKILEQMDDGHLPSQRALAESLNVSLGLVNSFIKRLVSKGYFKATHIPKNRIKYILTPKGVAEKTRLTYEYIKYSFGFYQDARQRLSSLLKGLEQKGVRKIAFFGVSDIAEIAYMCLHETSLELVAVIGGPESQNFFFNDKIVSPEKLGGISFDALLVTVLDPGEKVFDEIGQFGVSRDKVVLF